MRSMSTEPKPKKSVVSDANFSFLRLSEQERDYCIKYSGGKSHKKICIEIGENEGTVEQWKQRHEFFSFALDQIMANPTWIYPKIVLPQLLPALAEQDLNYLKQGEGSAPYKGVSSKRVEQWFQMAGYIGDNQAVPTSSLSLVIQNMGGLVDARLIPTGPDENSLMTSGPQRAMPAPEMFFGDEDEEPAPPGAEGEED